MNLEDSSGKIPPEGSRSEREWIEGMRQIGENVARSDTQVDDAILLVTVAIMAAPAIMLAGPEAASTAGVIDGAEAGEITAMAAARSAGTAARAGGASEGSAPSGLDSGDSIPINVKMAHR